MEKASPENNYHYNPKLKVLSNNLRKNMTKAEVCLWKYVLGSRQMKGYQFRRQRPVLDYIADFMCKELLLIIEVDGASHEFEEAYERDRERDARIETAGFTILRFTNWEALNQIGEVSGMIGEWIDLNAAIPPPGPRKPKRRRSEKRMEKENEV